MTHARSQLIVIPDALKAFSFTREILSSRHGRLMHKELHADLRELEFVSSETCICYLLKGRERFFDADGICTEIQAGELVIIPPNVRLQSDFRCQDGPLEAVMIFLAPALVRDALARLGGGRVGEPAGLETVPASQRLAAFMSGVAEVYGDLQVDADLVRLKLIELIMLLAVLHDRSKLANTLAGSLSTQHHRSVAYVARAFQDHDLQTGDLAALSGRSVPTFNREFRRIFGASPAQWRKQRKLDQAKGLLENTREAVTGIGLAVGYDSTSHFISAFKKQFGMTPGQFRAAIAAADP
ncbi:helix-turn-helix transcriptional regulator [Leisingera sp. HS039]|uniref:helix-turn-helix transcriptional regulator n=1 Tax=unclassified Leisingera TaxID=2614906 RepID=UPI00107119D1|nr:AraC family transcriptional regulator [Leisingera sp. NJS201]MBQ4825686.1 helix-turn-helix transcriptional regulator [Leisingera sp. HS039]QBR37877.1 AraC family transcriptional regulator [Leisingera sp. NJS201]